MSSALLVRFRPAGPWRLGSGNGARTQAGTVLHSDTLYSAITLAMRDCGWLGEWIAATAEAERPAVRLSSGYPFTGSTLLVEPPRTVWPPAQGGKLRWKSARFVPLTLVPRLFAGETLSDDKWAVDPASECLLPVFKNSVAPAPFRVTERVLAPVDRLGGAVDSVDRVACLQFAQGAGVWFVAAFADAEAQSVWAGRMRSAARLLADTGIGGGKSRGWGRSRDPQFGNVDLPEFFTGGATAGEGEAAWWLLSLYTPADGDRVDWDRGTYSVAVRSGRNENGDLKPASRMLAEGSVILSGSPPVGTARNVAPAELSHPVYRSGIALAVPVPYFEKQRWELVDHAAVSGPGGSVAGPETAVSPEGDSAADGADGLEAGSAADAVAGAEAESAADTAPAAQAGTLPETDSAADGAPGLEAESAADAAASAGTSPETDSAANAAPVSEAGSAADPAPGLEVESLPEADSPADAAPGLEAKSAANAAPAGEAGSGPEAHSAADAAPGVGAESGSEADAGADVAPAVEAASSPEADTAAPGDDGAQVETVAEAEPDAAVDAAAPAAQGVAEDAAESAETPQSKPRDEEERPS